MSHRFLLPPLRLTFSRWLLISAAVAWASVAFAGRAVDRITNGGFEQGTAGWEPAPQHKLVTDEQAAHSGKACLTGEVTGPRQALFLRRKIRLHKDNLYRFSIWARATKRTKLVLWAKLPGNDKRSMIASWRRVPKRWKRYKVPVAAPQDGVAEFQIIAPSSHGEPAGRIWVDDIALLETPMPERLNVSERKGFNDDFALARAGDGIVVCAWNSFRNRADSLQIATCKRIEGELRKLDQTQIIGGEGTYLLGLRAVSAGDKALVLYAAEKQKNWDIYAVSVDEDGPGKPVRITSDAAVDAKPAAAWHEGSLWVAWESNRNVSRQVFATSVRNGEVSEPVPVSGTDASDYSPSITVLNNGAVCIAWHSFRRNNYDIYLRTRNTGGKWQNTRRLTKAPSIDRHAQLLSRDDEIWLIYENAQTRRYKIGATNHRRIIAAKVTPEGLMAPKDYRKSPLYGRCEAASAAIDADGRLWVAFLKPRLPRSGWDSFITCCNSDAWTKPMQLSSGKGLDRRPGLLLDGPRAIVAIQNDSIPRSWSDVKHTPDAWSDIFLADIKLPDAPGSGVALEELSEPDEPFEAARIRVERGEDIPAPAITWQGKKLKLFFGDLHEHTDISICNRLGDQSTDESHQHMRDIARYDFACTTDHGYNFSPYLWTRTAKLARVNDDPGKYLTLLGEEWTSSFEKYTDEHPYGYYGHHNLILSDLYFPRWWNSRNGQTPADVWEELHKMNADFVHIPHQLADTGNVPVDWTFTNEHDQPVAEIFQTRGSYEYRGAPRVAGRTTPEKGYFMQDAWARGIVIGVIASPDHGGGYGKACVYAKELSREAIIEALRARHCYATTAAKIFLDVRVDGHLMGEKLPRTAGETVRVDVDVSCPAEIDRVEICRSNKFIHKREPEGKQARFTYIDRAPLDGSSYYYVRVMQEDEEIAWSSPVWFAPHK